MMKSNRIEEIISILNGAGKVAVFCHARPDGDALGSGLALKSMLEASGKQAQMFCEDVPPEKFGFLPETGEVRTDFSDGDFDLYVSVDCADVRRLGVFAKEFLKFRGITVNIDHHFSNEGFAKINYVSERPATCEIMTKIFRTAGWQITENVANLLMLGLITDSGNFTHCDVDKETFETAAYLRGKGADVNQINYQMFSRQSKKRALLFGRVMNAIRFAHDDKFAFIVIKSSDMADLGVDKSQTEGFVDFPLSIDGVEVSAAVMEFREGQYKVSLRSKGSVNVNSVAATFGGGGHILASGCMLFGSLEEVTDKLTFAVSRYL